MEFAMQINRLHLTPNEYSRPQRKLHTVKAIVIHWVANPSTTARANRDFFEIRADGGKGYGSAHYIIDDREVIEAIPQDEMAYHVGADTYTPFALEFLGEYPNATTIGVELCHPDWTGKFSETTWQRGVRFVADLLLAHALRPHHITTHHNITGKECPRWFVQHPAELDRFRWDVDLHMRHGA
jgi:N-acetylmuramoyl-L-alanine amidase CwlA